VFLAQVYYVRLSVGALVLIALTAVGHLSMNLAAH